MYDAKNRSTIGLGITKTNLDFLIVRLENKWPYYFSAENNQTRIGTIDNPPFPIKKYFGIKTCSFNSISKSKNCCISSDTEIYHFSDWDQFFENNMFSHKFLR